MKKIISSICFALAFFLGNAQNAKTSNYTIMSFNIRYDNPNDGANSWQNRKDNALNMLRYNEVDVLGLQEVLAHQLADIKKEFPEYEAIGVGREDGKQKGEFSPVLFNKNKFQLLQSGYFWLSETPTLPSKGWDAACERIATWVQLKDKKSGKKVFVLNTHFDHEGQVARQESVALIKTKIEQLSSNLPVILMGDFNATPESSIIQSLLKNDSRAPLFDAKNKAKVVYGPQWTFHDFGKIPFEKRILIDYFMVSPSVNVQKYGVLAETLNQTQLSDHTPILIKVTL
jgi:endonuclease/exonuclease/phosphatase family metal-dependent hydrolase